MVKRMCAYVYSRIYREQKKNKHNLPTILNYSGTSPQYSVNMSASTHTQAPHTGSFSPQAEPVDFSGLTRPIGIEYVSSLGSSSYSRESTPSNGSSVHFMEGYRDYNGKSIQLMSQILC